MTSDQDMIVSAELAKIIDMNAVGGTDDYPVVNVAGLIGDLTELLALRPKDAGEAVAKPGPIKLDIAGSALFVSRVQAEALLTIAVPLVEELSKRPQTHWGEIIVALREKAVALSPEVGNDK